RRARARTRFGWARAERATVGLAVIALGGAGAVLTDQFARMLRRRGDQRHDHEPLLEAAPAAAADTAVAAVRGYAAAPRTEPALLPDLRDGCWTREGLLSVQPSFGATAILSIAIITLRMLRRGERELGLEAPNPGIGNTGNPAAGARLL